MGNVVHHGAADFEDGREVEAPGGAAPEFLLPAGGREGRVTSAGVSSDNHACSLL